MPIIDTLDLWLQKDKGFKHKHDNLPVHPIGVKDHQKYFAGQQVVFASGIEDKGKVIKRWFNSSKYLTPMAVSSAVSSLAAKDITDLWTGWIKSSAYVDSIVLQLSVRKAFENVLTNSLSLDSSPAFSFAEKKFSKKSGGYQELVKTVYTKTQQDLARFGVSGKVTLYRGMLLPKHQAKLKQGQAVTLAQRPLSSWTLDVNEAKFFADSHERPDVAAENPVGVVYKADVPVELIFSTWKTGFGDVTEKEVVLLGAKIPAVIDAVYK